MKRLLRTILLLLVLVAVVAFFAAPQLREQAERMLYPRPYLEIVEHEAREFSLDEELVYAVMRTESKFRPSAQSHAGAKGLMQLTDETFAWVNSIYPPESTQPEIFTVEDNLHAGCALLRLLLDQFGTMEVALCAYNAGMGNVTEWLALEQYSADGESLHTIPYPETESYVKKVTHAMKKYRELY